MKKTYAANNIEDRRWFDYFVNLAPYAGQRVMVIFRTSAGPDGNIVHDWAGWSNPQIIEQRYD